MYGFKEFLTTNESDNEIIHLYLNNPKLSVAKIAQLHEKSEAEVYRILHANNINPNRLRAYHQKVHQLAHLGWGIQEIAQMTGYTSRNIRYILSKESLHD